jgi:hypothetical protein
LHKKQYLAEELDAIETDILCGRLELNQQRSAQVNYLGSAANE